MPQLVVLFLIFASLLFPQTPVPLAMTAANLVDGIVGNTYGSVANGIAVSVPSRPRYNATGGRTPYRFTVAAGTLPPGLSLNANTGVLEGVPGATGSYPFEVEVTDAANARARLGGQRINVVPAPNWALNGNVGNTFRLTATCGTAGGTGFAYSLSGAASFLSVNASTGVISGAPTSTGTFSATWSCANSGANAVRFTRNLVFTVAPIIRVTINPGTLGQRFNFTPVINYPGQAPFTYAITGGAPSPGLNLTSTSTGNLSGLLTTTGIFSWTLRRTDANNDIATVEYFQSVSGTANYTASPTLLSFEAVQGQITPITKNLAIRGAPANLPYNLTLSEGASAWLSLSSSSGSVPGSTVVSVNAAALPPGNYEAAITVSIPTASPLASIVPPLRVPVRLTVGAGSPPRLTTNATSISWAARPSDSGRIYRALVTNAGGGSAEFTLAVESLRVGDSLGWLSASVDKNSLSANQSANLEIRVSPAGLSAGTYSAAIVLRSLQPAAEIRVPVNVSLFECPRISLSPPSVGWIVYPGDPRNTKSISLSFSGGNIDPSWTLNADPRNVPMITHTGPSAGTGGTSFHFTIDPSQFNAASAGLNPWLSTFYLRGTCLNGLTIETGALVQEQPLPELSAEHIMVPSRSPQEPSQNVDFTITPKGPGKFAWRAELYNLQVLSPLYPKTEFVSLAPSSGIIDGTNPAPEVVRIYQRPDSVGGPSAYLAEYMFVFTREDGTEERKWLKVGQIVGIPGQPPPATPTIPSSPPLYQAPSASRFRSNDAACTVADQAFFLPFLNRDFRFETGRRVPLQVLLLNGCGQSPADGTLTVSFSNGDPNVYLERNEDGSWFGIWTPQNPADTVEVTFNYSSETLQAKDALSGTIIEDPAQPRLSLSGLRNAASGTADGLLSPGGLLLLQGSRLSNEIVEASTPDSFDLGEVSVRVNGSTARLLRVSPDGVLLRLPLDLEPNSPATLTLRRANRSTAIPNLTVVAATPGIFTVDASGSGQASIYRLEGESRTLANAENAALAGSTLELEATGLGLTNDEGKLRVPVKLLLGGGETEVEAQSALPDPARPGIYLVRFTLPEGLAASDATRLVLLADGLRSQPATFATK